MKFTISKNELSNALAVVLKGISSRSTLPVLSGIYIQASNDKLKLQATDLQMSIQYEVNALIEEEGQSVLPGKLFTEIVKNLSDAAVFVETTDEGAIVTCDASSFSIKTLDAEDFPGFPHVETTQEVSIPFSQFASMVKKVARVVSKDESRLVLTGVLVTVEGSLLKMVATDSYRLAISEADVPNITDQDFEAVIAGSFLQEVASLNRTDEPIRLALAENQLVITYQNTVFINRRIEGNFPNYKQLLPDGYTCQAKVEVNHLIAGVKRTSLMSQSSAPVKLSISQDSQTIQLSAAAQDVGRAQETIQCECTGEDTNIAFNYSYVLDGLQSVETDEVLLELQSSLKPGIFKSAAGERFLYLVMPVRIA